MLYASVYCREEEYLRFFKDTFVWLFTATAPASECGYLFPLALITDKVVNCIHYVGRRADHSNIMRNITKKCKVT